MGNPLRRLRLRIMSSQPAWVERGQQRGEEREGRRENFVKSDLKVCSGRGNWEPEHTRAEVGSDGVSLEQTQDGLPGDTR